MCLLYTISVYKLRMSETARVSPFAMSIELTDLVSSHQWLTTYKKGRQPVIDCLLWRGREKKL